MPVVDTATRELIDSGIRWLVSKQDASGGWSLTKVTDKKGHPIAMTGYVLLAMMGSGHLPGEGPYGDSMKRGMEFLLANIGPDGTFRNVDGGAYMYNHGIATIALCEIYGQIRTGALKSKLERLIGIIISSQSSSGGWRYQPRPQDADVSVTVIQVVALRSALTAGFKVPEATIERAAEYVRSCKHPSGGFMYQPDRDKPGFARTAAAIYSLQVLGEYDDPLVEAGSKYMFENMLQKEYFTYGHYYAAPAQYMIGGETWAKWYKSVHDELVPKAKREGNLAYWPNPRDGYQGHGPLFSTAVYLHVLAMPLQYLPLYQR